MRRSLFISVSTIALLALPLLAASATDPLLGKWMCKETLGDGGSFGFELKADGKAAAIGTATMQVEHWRRIDKNHIELTEVSIGNGSTSRDVCVYDARLLADGTLVMTSKTGWYKGKFNRTE